MSSDQKIIRLQVRDSLLTNLHIADAISLAVRFLSETGSGAEKSQELFKGRRPNQPSIEEIDYWQKAGAPSVFYRGGQISFGEDNRKILLHYKPETGIVEFLNPENLDFRTFTELCSSLLQDVVTFKFDRRYFIKPVSYGTTSTSSIEETTPRNRGVLLGHLIATETILIDHIQDEPNSDLLEVLHRTLEVAITRLSKTCAPIDVQVTPSVIEELPKELIDQVKQRILEQSLDEIRSKGREIIEEEIQKERRNLDTERLNLDTERNDVNCIMQQAFDKEAETLAKAKELEQERNRLDSLKVSLDSREKAIERAENLLRDRAFGEAVHVVEAARGRNLTAKEQQELHLFQIRTRRQGRRDQN